MDLGDAIYREITGGRSPRTEIGTFGGAVEYLLGKAGGVASTAARLAGVPASTFRGWLRGRQPKAGRAGDVVRAASAAERRDRLSRGRERRLRAPGALSTLKVIGTYGYDKGKGFTPAGGQREAAVGYYMDEVQDALVDAYLAGASTDELAEIFADAITDRGFYAETFERDNPDGHAWDIEDIEGWA